MKILAVLLIFVWHAVASTIVLDVYYVKEKEVTKSPNLGGYDFMVTEICKNGYKYTVFKYYGNDISVVQDFEMRYSTTLPIVCKN